MVSRAIANQYLEEAKSYKQQVNFEIAIEAYKLAPQVNILIVFHRDRFLNVLGVGWKV